MKIGLFLKFFLANKRDVWYISFVLLRFFILRIFIFSKKNRTCKCCLHPPWPGNASCQYLCYHSFVSPFFLIFPAISCKACNIMTQKPAVKYAFSGIIYSTIEYIKIKTILICFSCWICSGDVVGRYLEATGPTTWQIRIAPINIHSLKGTGIWIIGKTRMDIPI